MGGRIGDGGPLACGQVGGLTQAEGGGPYRPGHVGAVGVGAGNPHCRRVGTIGPGVGQITATAIPSKDYHLAAGPHRRESLPPGGGARDGHRRPIVTCRTIPPAVVQINGDAAVPVGSPPNDHFAACPHRRVEVTRGGRAGGGQGRPTVGRRIVAPAVVQIGGAAAVPVISAPDDHLTASPHCGMIDARGGAPTGGQARPTAGDRIVAPAIVEESAAAPPSAPDDHLAAGPHRRVKVAPSGGSGGGQGCPTVGQRIVAPSVVEIGTAAAAVVPAPDDHLIARPHRCVPVARGGCAVGRNRRPTVRHGIVAPAVVERVHATPDNHLAARPHRRVIPTGR